MIVRDLDTVSLDRIIDERVLIEPVEAYAVLQFVWERLRASRDSDGRMLPLPALSALAISATGDIDAMRPPREVSRTMRRPHEVAQELGHLLLQLLLSGQPDLPDVPAACLDAVRRVMMLTPIPGGLRPITAPEALFTALEAFRPRDTYAARAALFARWVATSRSATTFRAEVRTDGRPAMGTPTPRAQGVPTPQAGPTQRTSGKPARHAEVELRLHFDTAGSTPVQVVPALPARHARPDLATSRARLSLVVTMCLAVLGMMPR
ncbi:hypothetical protein LuPra_02031 [Luteitalea pratensis]|uniref:Uncharacterized protein n=1 Tax=Luteitalea pratensis TaxID=1855912 RepID=A0A143PJT0_LUTPR|nr:hypothetical protein [Luteitalea pratensis]AMY08825.1 hypothetical protein LuPra_02031 [Luteitalea pratensis]